MGCVARFSESGLAPIRVAHSVYFDRVVPFVGGLVSDRAAYRYLPQSTAYLPPPDEMRALLEGAGFVRVVRHRILLGAVQILTAVRAA